MKRITITSARQISPLVKERKSVAPRVVSSVPPGLDYIDAIKEAGPQKKESILAFHCRVAYLERGRTLWIRAYIEVGGNLMKAAEVLGISHGAARPSLDKFGLRIEDLEALRIAALNLTLVG